MTTTQLTEPQLLEEVQSLEAEINTLQTHLNSLRNQPTPAPLPETLTALEAIAHAQDSAKRQQEVAIQIAEAKVVDCSLDVLRSQLKSKRESLEALKQSKGFERLKEKATAFNHAVDEAISILAEMRQIDSEIRSSAYQPLTVADVESYPYCSILNTVVRIRDRGDVLRDQSIRVKGNSLGLR